MIFIKAAPREDLAWIEGRSGCVLSRGAEAIEAVEEESGQIVGMVAYDDWTENAVVCHMAVEHPRVWWKLLRPAFSYPFEQGGRSLMLGIIPANNERSWRFAKGVGFRETHRIKDGWAKGEDLLLLEMRKEECRFLKGRG